MTGGQIKNWIKEAHDNAVEKGFYPDGEEKNIGELLMLIVSELGEALEAHRCGRFAPTDQGWYNLCVSPHPLENIELSIQNGNFKNHIKDTFEDEIADVFIRLFDLCGYLGIEGLKPEYSFSCFVENVGEWLIIITHSITEIWVNSSYDNKALQTEITDTFQWLLELCKRFNIPIEKHITAKMAYNKTRPKKHGKEY